MTDELLTVVVRKREQQAEGVIVLELVDPQGKPLPVLTLVLISTCT